MIPLPSRLDRVSSFLAVDIFQATQALESQGRSVIHLEFGEPDFPTPEIIREAAVRALSEGKTHYTHSLGILELRETIADFHNTKYGLALHPDQVLVSMGTSVLMQLLMLMLLDNSEAQDEVIVTDPSYACYGNYITLAGGKPVYVPIRAADGFQPDVEAIRAAITPRTRALIVCSPANPTGVSLRPAVMRDLVALGVPVVSDEIYHGLTYAGVERSILNETENGFVLNGFSKYFAMTGWRLGYLIYPRYLMPTVMKLHQSVVLSATEFVQYAGIAAMREARAVCESYRAEYDRRRLFVIQRLAEIGLPLHYEPTGAFYVFADMRHYGTDSLALARELLEATGVACTPGVDFGPGGEGYLRFSYANSMDNIAEGLNRLGDFLKTRSVA